MPRQVGQGALVPAVNPRGRIAIGWTGRRPIRGVGHDDDLLGRNLHTAQGHGQRLGQKWIDHRRGLPSASCGPIRGPGRRAFYSPPGARPSSKMRKEPFCPPADTCEVSSGVQYGSFARRAAVRWAAIGPPCQSAGTEGRRRPPRADVIGRRPKRRSGATVRRYRRSGTRLGNMAPGRSCQRRMVRRNSWTSGIWPWKIR